MKSGKTNVCAWCGDPCWEWAHGQPFCDRRCAVQWKADDLARPEGSEICPWCQEREIDTVTGHCSEDCEVARAAFNVRQLKRQRAAEEARGWLKEQQQRLCPATWGYWTCDRCGQVEGAQSRHDGCG